MPFGNWGGEAIFYREGQGKGAGQTLVFLHSLGASSAIWTGQMAAFEQSYRVLAPDAPGHGNSSRRQMITLDGVTDAFIEMADTLNVGRATWIGLSMGGGQVLRIFERRPDLVGRMVLADTFPSMPGASGTARVEDIEGRLATTPMDRFAANYAQTTLLSWSYERWGAVLEEAVRFVSAQAYIEMARACFLSDLDHVLPTIDVPVLVVRGALDDRAPAAQAEKLAGGIPGARLVTLERAAHLAQLDQPEAFTKALQAFLGAGIP